MRLSRIGFLAGLPARGEATGEPAVSFVFLFKMFNAFEILSWYFLIFL